MIKVEKLSYQYPNGPHIQFPDFEVQTGESLLVLGSIITLPQLMQHQLG